MVSKLSIELVEMVFSHLHKAEDIANARLLSNVFPHAGLKYLTDKVYLSKYEKPDLEAMQAISEHPVVRSTITTLICDDRTFTKMCQVPSQANAMDVKRAPHRYGCEPDSRKQAWYDKMCSEENRMKETGVHVAMLSSVLPKLPNLNHVIVTDCCGKPQEREGSRPEGGDIHQTLFHRQSASSLDLPAPQNWNDVVFRSSDSWDSTLSRHQGYINLMRILSITERAIETLEVVGEIVGLSHLMFNAPAEDLQHLDNVFKNLRTLKLTVDTQPTEDYYAQLGPDPWVDDTLGNRRIARVLAFAPLLECLELSFMGIGKDAYYQNESVPFDISLGLGDTTWRCLRRFALVACDLPNGRALASFLLRHKHTLKSLFMELIKFQDDTYTWGRVFEDMRKGGMKLDECEISIISDPVNKLGYRTPLGPWGSLVKKYLEDGKSNIAL